MATPFQALVDEIRALDGSPKVTYPEGSAAHPTVERVLRLKRGQHVPTFGEADPDSGRFPNNTLEEQTELKSDAQYVEVYRKYLVLPGPVVLKETALGDTGISILVSRQKVRGTDIIDCGEFLPSALNVQSIGVAVNGVCTVALNADHGLPPGAWVTFAGTNSTPVLNGNRRIVGVPGTNQVQIAVNVTVAGTVAGTMQAMHRIVRELETTGSQRVSVKTESMIAVEDVSAFNEDVACWKAYPFPDSLQGFNLHADTAESTQSGPDAEDYAYSWGGGAGISIQHGSRDPCKAKRKRHFFSGPPPDSFAQGLTPTTILLSSGTFVIQGGSKAVRYSEDGASSSESDSVSFRTGPIPPLLTLDRSGSGSPPPPGYGFVPGTVGAGQAQLFTEVAPSYPLQFYKGDIITVLEDPVKHEAALWEYVQWDITVPYTSGKTPADPR